MCARNCVGECSALTHRIERTQTALWKNRKWRPRNAYTSNKTITVHAFNYLCVCVCSLVLKDLCGYNEFSLACSRAVFCECVFCASFDCFTKSLTYSFWTCLLQFPWNAIMSNTIVCWLLKTLFFLCLCAAQLIWLFYLSQNCFYVVWDYLWFERCQSSNALYKKWLHRACTIWSASHAISNTYTSIQCNHMTFEQKRKSHCWVTIQIKCLRIINSENAILWSINECDKQNDALNVYAGVVVVFAKAVRHIFHMQL